MRWRRTRAGLKWTLAGASLLVAALCLLTGWLIGQWVYPASGPTLSVAMAGETVVVNAFTTPIAPGTAPSQIWWGTGPVQWNYWFQFRRTPSVTQLVIPMWPLAAATGIGALLLWWSERPERRRRLGQCAACGYDRRGLAVAAPCPECGAVARSVDLLVG